MSASPHPSMTSPPTRYSPSANGAAPPASPSNAQLATLLSASYRESESLKAELAATRKRLENSDRVVHALQQTDQANGSYNRIIADFERRAETAERDREAAESRLRLFAEAWREIEHYLVSVEARMSDARASFSRVVAEGRAILLPQELPPAPRFPLSGGVSLAPQGVFYEGHRHTRSSGTIPSPSLAHPPPYGAQRRPRANSIEDTHLAPPQPPLKRPRNDRDYERPPSQHHSRRAPHDDQPHGHSGHAHAALRGAPSAPGIPAGPGVPPSAPRARSRSRSRTSDGSMSVDDMLLDAATGSKDDTEHKFWSRHGGPPESGPLPQPGQMSTYQTHVFAPPVTGAPGAMRRSKLPLGSASQPTLESPPSLAQIPTAPPAVTVSAPLAEVASEPVRTGSTFPGTNAQGQRICRQCGLPGRYKDGKCVEKWGPGPEGPGTVCDRCRKKMKRVERRGTLESQQQLAAQQSQSQTLPSHHPSARPPHPLQAQVTAPSVDRERERGIARSDTMPVSHGGGIGPGGTQLLSSAPGPYDRERSERSREQTRSRVEHLRKEDEHSRERELRDRERSRDSREAGGPRPGSAASGAGSGGSGTRRTPPSPPAIATLQPHADADGEDENENENESEGTDEKPPRESHVRSTSARDSPRVGPGAYGAKRASPPLSNRSADADGDAEGDVDADDDILAAVDAAEQSKSFKDEDMAD